nr:uncharacterized protein LOC129271722 [Lytechinus pictus]
MGKADIKSAFRLLPVRPEDFELLGMVYEYDPQLPPNVERVALFVSYLSLKGYAGSTIQTYISGLAFYLSSSGEKDVTKSFVVARLMEGCRRSTLRRDARHPITISILNKMFCLLEPPTRREFGSMIKRCLAYGNMPAAKFSSHSFRIGAATTAAMAGCSDAQIQRMGRWVSDTHRRYVRLDMVI